MFGPAYDPADQSSFNAPSNTPLNTQPEKEPATGEYEELSAHHITPPVFSDLEEIDRNISILLTGVQPDTSSMTYDKALAVQTRYSTEQAEAINNLAAHINDRTVVEKVCNELFLGPMQYWPSGARCCTGEGLPPDFSHPVQYKAAQLLAISNCQLARDLLEVNALLQPLYAAVRDHRESQCEFSGVVPALQKKVTDPFIARKLVEILDYRSQSAHYATPYIANALQAGGLEIAPLLEARLTTDQPHRFVDVAVAIKSSPNHHLQEKVFAALVDWFEKWNYHDSNLGDAIKTLKDYRNPQFKEWLTKVALQYSTVDLCGASIRSAAFEVLKEQMSPAERVERFGPLINDSFFSVAAKLVETNGVEGLAALSMFANYCTINGKQVNGIRMLAADLLKGEFPKAFESMVERLQASDPTRGRCSYEIYYRIPELKERLAERFQYDSSRLRHAME